LRVAEIAACDKGLTILESFGTPDDLWLRSGAARSAAVFCGGANSRPRHSAAAPILDRVFAAI
jgi:hypothetical protein